MRSAQYPKHVVRRRRKEEKEKEVSWEQRESQLIKWVAQEILNCHFPTRYVTRIKSKKKDIKSKLVHRVPDLFWKKDKKEWFPILDVG